MNRPSAFARLAVVTVAATMTLIAVGAIVRATGSGLGCPDWPRCHGSWIPPLRAEALIEYSHRLAATVTGGIVLALAIFAWVRFRAAGRIFWPSFAALCVVLFQGALGRLVVERELEGRLVAFHFATSLVLLGLVVVVAANALLPRGGRLDGLTGASIGVALGAFAVATIGALVVQWGASLAPDDWPLVGGGVAPPEGQGPLVHYTHRAAALLLGVALVYLAVRAVRARAERPVVMLAHGALGLWVAQALAGAANVLTRLSSWAVVSHVVLGVVLWGTTVGLAVVAYRRGPRAQPAAGPPAGRGAAAPVRAYFLLTKPRVIELLLITTVPAMVVAAEGWPPLSLILATLAGGAMAAGGANAINCYYDRDLDERMQRTAARPIPRHEVEPRRALVFGIVLSSVSFALLWSTTNLLAAGLAFGAILFYVLVYTVWLKRSTPSNIVIGGAAGAMPALVGWAAVTGRVEVPAVVLFAVIFYWTPPHFWALALRYADDYARAGVPMLPVVRGPAETARHMMLYAFVLSGVSLLLYPAARMGNLYLVAAVVLGGMFVGATVRLRRSPDPKAAMSVFRHSISYLVLLFTAVAVDRLVGGSAPEAAYRLVLGVGAALFVGFEAAILAAVLRSRRRSEPRGVRASAAAGGAATPVPPLSSGPFLRQALLPSQGGGTGPGEPPVTPSGR